MKKQSLCVKTHCYKRKSARSRALQIFFNLLNGTDKHCAHIANVNSTRAIRRKKTNNTQTRTRNTRRSSAISPRLHPHPDRIDTVAGKRGKSRKSSRAPAICARGSRILFSSRSFRVQLFSFFRNASAHAIFPAIYAFVSSFFFAKEYYFMPVCLAVGRRMKNCEIVFVQG